MESENELLHVYNVGWEDKELAKKRFEELFHAADQLSEFITNEAMRYKRGFLDDLLEAAVNIGDMRGIIAEIFEDSDISIDDILYTNEEDISCQQK